MRRLRAFFLPVCALILLVAAWRVPLPFFLEVPGEVVTLNDRVRIQFDDLEELEGEFLLLTVNLRRGTVARLAQGLVDPTISLVAESRLIPPGVPDRVFFEQQRSLFRATAEVAAAVGLRQAGFAVDPSDITGDGVLVLRVIPDSPADGVLEPGDVIVAVDGEPVHLGEELQQIVRGERGERMFRLTVKRGDAEEVVALAPGVVPTAQGEIRGFGVQIETSNPRVNLPVEVSVEGGRIGGPSAGMMIALTVYDLVSEEDLLAGRRVAGTGGVDATGRVRPIGGIEQKVVAAERRGADVLLVPAALGERAVAALPPGSALDVIPVASIEEAIEGLRGADPQADRNSAGRSGRPLLQSVSAAGSTGRVDGEVPRDAAP
jgi:Lon-like protease